MNIPFKLGLIRGGRFLVSYIIAFGLWLLACKLSSMHLPEYLTPVVAAVISAIGKYIRETLKLNVPF